MFKQNIYTIGVVPSLLDEAKFCSILSKEFPSLSFSSQPVFIPISPSFELSEKGLGYLVKEIQESISFLHNIRIDWGTCLPSNDGKELLVIPSSNQLIHTLAKYIRNAILDSRFVSSVHESKQLPELSIKLPMDFQTEEQLQHAKAILLDFSWRIESISFLQLGPAGFQEKFFLPLAEQRKERTKSHSILPCV